MDQRTWRMYTMEWLKQARKLVKPNGVFAIFIDWRQLAALTDAVQMSGWVFRGIAVWAKPGARPQKGRFAAGAEYIVWGSKGAMPFERNAPILPGVFNYPYVTGKVRLHQAEKPLELMREVVRFCEKGGKILDPFCGSGTTLAAAELENHDSVGIDSSNYYVNVAINRMSALLSDANGCSL